MVWAFGLLIATLVIKKQAYTNHACLSFSKICANL